MRQHEIQLDQLSNKLRPYRSIARSPRPSIGWVKTIRTSVGMSLEQLGNKLGITRQSVRNLEKRESEGSVTIKALEEAAAVLNMKLVYGFVPLDGSIEKLIENRAKALATEIVTRTSISMKLEGQENSPERIEKAIKERTEEIIAQMPKKLWD